MDPLLPPAIRLGQHRAAGGGWWAEGLGPSQARTQHSMAGTACPAEDACTYAQQARLVCLGPTLPALCCLAALRPQDDIVSMSLPSLDHHDVEDVSRERGWLAGWCRGGRALRPASLLAGSCCAPGARHPLCAFTTGSRAVKAQLVPATHLPTILLAICPSTLSLASTPSHARRADWSPRQQQVMSNLLRIRAVAQQYILRQEVERCVQRRRPACRPASAAPCHHPAVCLPPTALLHSRPSSGQCSSLHVWALAWLHRCASLLPVSSLHLPCTSLQDHRISVGCQPGQRDQGTADAAAGLPRRLG